MVLRLLDERSADRPCRPGAAGAAAVHSLVDRIRRLRPSDEEGNRLLRTLHTALDDRPADRIALLHGQLTGAGPVDRCNAVLLAAALVREWRGDHSRTVALLGEQLSTREAEEEQGRLRDTTVAVLAELFALAAPAADRLHALAVARPDRWVQRWPREAPLLGRALHALTLTGDPRAVPLLAKVVAGPVVPGTSERRSPRSAPGRLLSRRPCGRRSPPCPWRRPARRRPCCPRCGHCATRSPCLRCCAC